MAALSHSFSVQHAQEYGVEAAILINHFSFWIHQNRERDRNLINGRTWMYQTIEEIASIYPYWKWDAVHNVIKNLVKKGVLLKGNHNKSSWDRTVWYAFADEERFLPKSKKLSTIPGNPGIESGEARNRVRETPETIPDTKTDTNEDKKRESLPAPPLSSDPPQSMRKEGTNPRALHTNPRHLDKKTPKDFVYYADNVKLLPEQYDKLCEAYGKKALDDMIVELSDGIGSKGYKYNCHASTLRSWFRRRQQEAPKEAKPSIDRSAKNPDGTPAMEYGF